MKVNNEFQQLTYEKAESPDYLAHPGTNYNNNIKRHDWISEQ